MSNNKEIEIKHLVKRVPKGLDRHQSADIRQGYLIKEDEVVLRVRTAAWSSGEKTGFITVKGKGDKVRDEYEMEIPYLYALVFLGKCSHVLEKIRYIIPSIQSTCNETGHTIELDIFQGSLKGLVLAEVEFESEFQSLSCVPDWFGDDVTDRKDYSNVGLLYGGIPDDYSGTQYE